MANARQIWYSNLSLSGSKTPFFWGGRALQHVAFPRPGTEPVLPQRQYWILNLLYHMGTLLQNSCSALLQVAQGDVL